jgi:hypothetical protein
LARFCFDVKVQWWTHLSVRVQRDPIEADKKFETAMGLFRK